MVFSPILEADDSMPNEGEIEKRFENLLVGSDSYMPSNKKIYFVSFVFIVL